MKNKSENKIPVWIAVIVSCLVLLTIFDVAYYQPNHSKEYFTYNGVTLTERDYNSIMENSVDSRIVGIWNIDTKSGITLAKIPN